jgi:hypothetical protein
VLYRGIRRIRSRLLVAAALCVTLFPIISPTASRVEGAGASCASSNYSRFAGYGLYSRLPANWHESPEGVKSTLTVRSGAMCPTVTYPSQFTTAWVMIQDRFNALRYAQAGYMRVPSGPGTFCNRDFAEYNNGGPFTRVFYSQVCLAEGSSQSYTVKFLGPAGPNPPPSSANRFGMYTAGALILINDFDPWAAGWSFAPDYLGETKYDESDQPGTSSATATYTSMQIQSVDTGTYTSTPGYLFSFADGARYHRNASGFTWTWIWTAPL